MADPERYLFHGPVSLAATTELAGRWKHHLPMRLPDWSPGVPVDRAPDQIRMGRRTCRRHGTQPHVLGEALFREALTRERRRGERFDQRFVVVFVHLLDHTSATLTGVVRSIATVAGDDAIVGWAHQGEELGIILPDLGLRAAGVARDAELSLRQQLTRELGTLAPPRASIRVRVLEGPKLPAIGAVAPEEPACNDLPAGPWLDVSKRAMDVLGSLLLLAATLPLFLLVAVLVKVTSAGPVLFRQPRIGQRGRPFTMLKFRTMQANADPTLHQKYVDGFIKAIPPTDVGEATLFKMANDPRVTPIGRALRRSSLDELPQLWNVLKGEMSLVGPRPPIRYETEQYRGWHLRRILDAKPGITGLWQVKGRSRTTFDQMVRLDLQYVQRRSLWLDIKILLVTPYVVITGNGAC